MMDPQQDYLLAWSAYGIAAFVGLMVWFKMTSWISWRWLREPLRLLVAILLFVPSPVLMDEPIYAPSIAMLALDILFKSSANLWRAVADLSMYGAIAFIIYFALAFVRFLWELWRGKPEPKPSKAAKKAQKKAAQQAAQKAHNQAEHEAAKQGKVGAPRSRYESDPELDEAIRIDSNGDRRLRIEPKLFK